MSTHATHTHHSIDYIEFTVRDMDAARAFYAAAFGWTFNEYGPSYSGIRKADGGEAGGLRLDADAEPAVGAVPLVILYSADLDASVTAVLAAGGTITQAPYAFPGGRRFHFCDPTGNSLAVWAAQ